MYYNNGQWEEAEKARVKHLVVFVLNMKTKESQLVLCQIITRSAILGLYM